MVFRSGRIAILSVLLLLGSILQAFAAEGGTMWRLDAPAADGLPRNLRLCSDAAGLRTEENQNIWEGIDWLRISGSGQPAEAELPVLYARIRQETAAPVYILDLRQESHGFFGGSAVSWYGKNNWSNRGMNAKQAEADDILQLDKALNQEIEAVPLGNEDKASFQAVSGIVKHAVTEREAAEKAGFRYVRIAATDQVWPEPQAVDEFLEFYKSLPAEPVWVHFHCQAGHGRTTIFMAMYDMLRNPNAALETIAARQKLIGGTDVLAAADESTGSWRARLTNEKARNMRLFYRYVQEQQPAGFAVSWTEWLQKNQ